MKRRLRCSYRQILLLSALMVVATTIADASIFPTRLLGAFLLPPSGLASDPPVIVGVPGDTTIYCASGLPAKKVLLASDDFDGDFLIGAVDFPDSSLANFCAGDTIRRVWTAIDSEQNVTRDTQLIIIAVDDLAPIIRLPNRNDTVDCEELDYETWINSIRLQLAFAVEDSCNVTIDDDAPTSFTHPCNSLLVTFTFTDECGNSSDWSARLTSRDEEAPQLIGVPADISISCSDPIPPVASVTASDNCLTGLVPTFKADTLRGGQCPSYEYEIRRIWTVKDSCYTTSDTMRIIIRDILPPDFNVPLDITVSCDVDLDNLTAVGNITGLADNCDPTPQVTYTDTRFDSTCGNGYKIQRMWQAKDACNNTRTKLQEITIFDNKKPGFLPPPNKTVDCSEVNDLNIAGQPANVTDNCDQDVKITMVDTRFPVTCPNNYSIRRKWTVTDACGNDSTYTQILTVEDKRKPFFSTPPTDQTIVCVDELSIEQAFADFVNGHAGAVASDNCSLAEDLIWFAYNSGTTQTPSLPDAFICPANDSIILQRAVDFIIKDECGNVDTATAVFRIKDSFGPTFVDCALDTTVNTDPGVCFATYRFLPPYVEEECAIGTIMDSVVAVEAIQSDALPENAGDVPANSVDLELRLKAPVPINLSGNARLVVKLTSADAEDILEFFNVYGEDGSYLGKTATTDVQCGFSDTTLIITPDKFNAWAADGVVKIRFEPNIPEGLTGDYAINAICPASSVRGTLLYESKDLSLLTLEFSADGGPRMPISRDELTATPLDEGEHTLKFYVEDCAGHQDSCSYSVTVVDNEGPMVQCPNDIIKVVKPGECSVTMQLPLPLGIRDNCAAGSAYEKTFPSDTASAYFKYVFNPNLPNYAADLEGWTYKFTGLAGNSYGPAEIRLALKGDFAGDEAFIVVRGENDRYVGETVPNVTTCGEETIYTILIPQDTFNRWAADGEITFTFKPKKIVLNPFFSDDGINPCDPSKVKKDGDIDSVSYMFVTLFYNYLTPSYFAEGATPIPSTDLEQGSAVPIYEFGLGMTTVYFSSVDDKGNADTCSFVINVVDREAPVALCKPTTLFAHPGGLEILQLNPLDIDAGSRDNCSIDTMIISPNSFGCAQAGTNANVTLTVIDGSGNTSTCSTLVRIQSLPPNPTASAGLCGGDTLFLKSNPPAATGGLVYTYKWTGPNGFTSTARDPFIPNVGPNNAGSYLVEITGLTGCKSIGTIEVGVEDLPLAPSILSSTNYCVDEDIVLTSSIVPAGSNVLYKWYQGVPPNGVLLGSTSVPTLSIESPHSAGSRQFYLIIEDDGCPSNASPPVAITTSSIPQAIVAESAISVCEGESITLSTFVTGPNITYEWTGPNGFISQSQFPQVIISATPANSGAYKLVVFNNGCASEPDFSVVTVLQTPPVSLISSNGPVCEGNELTFKASLENASVYHWIAPDLQEYLTNSNTYSIPSASLADAGQWRVYTTRSGCDSELSEAIGVVVNSQPNAVASASSTAICEGGSVQFFSTPNVTGASYTWKGPGGYTSATQNPVIENLNLADEGTYAVTITTPEGCFKEASIDIRVLRTAAIQAVSNNGPDCLEGPMDIILRATIFPADNGSYTYQWTGPDGFVSTDANAIIPQATAADNGNYQLVVITGDGCVSAAATTLVDVANPPLTPSIPDFSTVNQGPFCEHESLLLMTSSYEGNEVTYNWKTPQGIITTEVPSLSLIDLDVSNSGNYSVFVTVDGCDSKESGLRSIKVNEVPVVIASANAPVCAGGIIDLKAEGPLGATYQWLGPGFNSTLPNPKISNADSTLHNGVYAVRAVLNGCLSEPGRVDVDVQLQPVQPLILQDGPVCISLPNQVLTLKIPSFTSTSGATYRWLENGNPVATTEEPLLEISNFIRYTEDTYNFTVQADLAGCISPMSVPAIVTMNAIPKEERAKAGRDTSVCVADELILFAEPIRISTGKWTLIGSANGVEIVDETDPATPIKNVEGGANYLFRWSLSNGACENFSTDTVAVGVKPIDESLAGDDLLACIADNIFLNGTPPANGKGTWSQPTVQTQLGVIIVDPDNPATEIIGLQPGNLYEFSWTLSGGCGRDKDEVYILISDPFPNAGKDTVVCNDQARIVLNAAAPIVGSFGKWSSVDPGIGFDNIRKAKAEANNLKLGENTFVWTIDDAICGESSRDTVKVFYKRNPVANPDEGVTPFAGETLLNVMQNDLVPPNTTVSIVKSPNLGQVVVDDQGMLIYTAPTNFVGKEEFIYELCSQACECSQAKVTISVGEDASCSAPNIFTPNGDNVNDFFVVPCLLDLDMFPQSQVIIFNRWGDEVFRSAKPYTGDWRGTFNGQDLPVGTYFYILDFGDGQERKTGFVQLQR